MRNTLTVPNRARRSAAAIVLAATLPACAAQPSDDRLDRIRAAEDARATTAEGLAPILAALHDSTEPSLLRTAVRAMGRLQRPAFVDSLAPFLSHADSGVRAEAANAIAQSVQPGRDTAAVARARELLLARLTAADTAGDAGALSRSLGRLPHESSEIAQQVAEHIAAALAPTDVGARTCVRDGSASSSIDSLDRSRTFGALHGIYAVARRTRQLGCAATALSHAALGYRAAGGDTAVWIRELAVLALQAANAADTALVRRVSSDPDPRVRRLAMRVVRGTPVATVVQLATSGLGDSAAMVRIDAARALLLARSPEGCQLARRALDDASPHVRLEAIDAVAAACGAEVAPPLLDSLVRLLPADTAAAASTWHSAARALVALARSAPTLAPPHFAYFRMHPVWQVRASLGAAARAIADTAVLLDLLGDGDANVREETITHLATLTPALRERAVRAGLEDSSYQVVLAAAQRADSVAAVDVQTLAASMQRLTSRGQETSRDPRAALLDRIAQRGSARDSAVLRPYVADFDTLIARRAAALLGRWTGEPVTDSPRPARSGPTPSRASRAAELRITMSPAAGGGRIVVRLFPEEAPATIARIASLARAGYYDGRTFHRVVANFVIQGGSPDANEYVGDGPFMRDELGLRSHTRGTLGISTRGRDTGDAQIFVNLVDNFRLDHDYTVFAEVVEGMDVVDRLLAGAVMQRVEVVGR